jgi:hypothetical protein
LQPPSADNAYLVEHTELLRRSYRLLTGRDLVDQTLAPEKAARELFYAPFVVLSHSSDPDPIMTYANRAGLELFELDWQALIVLHSRLTAEALAREERARLLEQVTTNGYMDDYSGVRISRSGRRFRIERATVWNLVDAQGIYRGQAAMFARWEHE